VSTAAHGGPGSPDASWGAVVTDAVTRALAEDLGSEGDVTAELVPEGTRASFALRARRAGVLAGADCATEAFRRVGPEVELRWLAGDGDVVEAGQTVLEVRGPLRPILTAERTALNFLGHLSGIATLTAQYVAAAHAKNPAAEILDTRKTTPGLRVLEKAAVRAGGGTNHRAGLFDAVLVKDNHLAGTTISSAVARARAQWPAKMVQIECDSLEHVAEAARAGADAVLLDNMDPDTIEKAVALAHEEASGPILTEVSGGVTLETIGPYAAAGPDRISVGALTHSAPVLDLGLDLLWTDDGTHAALGLQEHEHGPEDRKRGAEGGDTGAPGH
jgi:nicotinate-nucleotide pyrophosphorylase (carboxylating)